MEFISILGTIFTIVFVLLAMSFFAFCIIKPEDLPKEIVLMLLCLGLAYLSYDMSAGTDQLMKVQSLAKSGQINLHVKHVETVCRIKTDTDLCQVYICRNNWVDSLFQEDSSTVQVTLANDTNQVLIVPDSLWRD